MSILSKLKMLFFVEILLIFIQLYGLYYVKNHTFLTQFFLIALCGTFITFGIALITAFHIKWEKDKIKKFNGI